MNCLFRLIKKQGKVKLLIEEINSKNHYCSICILKFFLVFNDS